MTTLAAARDAAAVIGYPVVLKVVSDDIAQVGHGLVAVGLVNETILSTAFDEMQSRVAKLGRPIGLSCRR